jgi:preprotein translocase subunit YajC
LIIGIFYLLIYRPMRRRQKNLETMIANLKNGDKVITSGGVYGTVAGIKESTILLKVADQVKLEVAKSAVASMQAPSDTSAN